MYWPGIFYNYCGAFGTKKFTEEQKCILKQEMIEKVIAWFGESKEHNRIHTFYNEKQAKDVYMIALRDENGTLIGYYEKHEYRTRDEEPFYNF